MTTTVFLYSTHTSAKYINAMGINYMLVRTI